MTINIGKFYTNTPMDRYKYTRFYISKIPSEVIDEYNLLPNSATDTSIFALRKPFID